MTSTISVLAACLILQAGYLVPPPSPLRGYGKDPARVVVRADDAVRGAASYDTLRRSVTLSWSYEVGEGETRFSTQVEALAFWPTDVASFGDNALCVAGKRRNGDTVIEVWTLETPAEPVTLRDARTGEAVTQDLSVAITAKAEVYGASAAGRDMVRFMWRNHGRPHELLVLFAGSSDLYALDTRTGEATLLLSSRSGTGVPVVPELRGGRMASSAEHATHGFVYVLRTDINEPGGPPLVLRDLDKDGDLDDWLVVEDWEGQGLGDARLYVRTF